MPHRYGLLVPGISTKSEPLLVRAPFDRTAIGEVATADAKVVEHALKTAYGLYRNRDGWLPLAKRIAILEEAASILLSRGEKLAVESAREGGKPLVDSRVEVARAADSLKICVETLRTQAGEVIPMGTTASSTNRMAFTQTEPIGVVVAVSAFNHPLNLIAHQVGPAIAAGCPVIIKPAKATPLTCLRFIEILREAGLPDEWCLPVIPENNELSTKMVTDPRVAFFSFIGSARVGWDLRSKLAPGTRCALEHGGVAPVVLAGDADVAYALPLIAKGGFYHAGQVCVSVQRVYVDRGIAGHFAEELAKLAQKMIVGDPTMPETEIGPLIDPAETRRIHDWVEEAVAGGAQLLCGGQPMSETMYAPTVLLDPPGTARVSTQEVFGPVVCVYSVDSIDQAIERANSLPVAFQAAVFTRSLETALRCYHRLEASAVMVNDHTAFRVDWMPFAGLRASGHGVGGIPHTIHDMQVRKMMVLRSKEIAR
ncbi:aldehyde dehydrogenase family protein [Solimonas sp. K1W22B-7]|uniref:aldehyde dehydrogenase family protein n=1 Tax=Solimonas sp. K1W22B-7 TaxID=2303331 RepID=UPI000E333B0F|nr:aldehyde dehydrogenase family protein [Solimonas sp. K1W22B-7]AXQ30851.1 aldehyde dehydrogenase family protein [Solimonas sp. K1W22B-7]